MLAQTNTISLAVIAAQISLLLAQYGDYPAVRFAMDDDNDLSKFAPYPIDICIQARVDGDRWIKFECSSSGDTLTKYVYSDECETSTSQEEWTSVDKAPCGWEKFSCTGDDYYVTTAFWDTNTCPSSEDPLIRVPLAVGCFCDTDYSSIVIGCETVPSYTGTLTTYTDYRCKGNTTVRDLNACQNEPLLDGTTTYNRFLDCVVSSDEPTAQPTAEPTTGTGMRITSMIGLMLAALCLMFVSV